MRRGAAVSLLLHVAAGAALLTLRPGAVSAPTEPPRIEILFGDTGATATPRAPSGTAAAASQPAANSATTPAADSTGAPGHPARASPAASAGMRVDEPDGTMIPARDDPGNAAPVYPPAARDAHVQGDVVLRLNITATGEVESVETLQSSGSAVLDAAAVAALSHWHFRPARRNGMAVAWYRDQPVRFVLPQ